jgi:GNAT superfamily N-acetyltransferase
VLVWWPEQWLHRKVSGHIRLIRDGKAAEGTSRRRDQPIVNVAHGILMRIFGRPKGILGRLGGIILARTNQPCNAWVIDLLGIQPHDSVLEVGFGPGVGNELLERLTAAGFTEAHVVEATAAVRAQERGWQASNRAPYGPLRGFTYSQGMVRDGVGVLLWPAVGSGDARRGLLPYANPGELPIGVVALYENELCGVAALTSASVMTHSHLGPWVAACLVSPSYRRRGIGMAMVRTLEEVARNLGCAHISCGTSTAGHLLERRG